MFHTIKKTPIFCLLIFITFSAEARKIPGYVITNQYDTLHGEIKVSHFNLITGEFLFSNICLEQFYMEVHFRETQQKKYIRYEPGEIIEYGFNYKRNKYIFHSYILESNTPFSKEKEKPRFLQLRYSDGFLLYKDLNRSIDRTRPDVAFKPFYDETYLFSDYYIYNSDNGLTKVEKSGKINNIKDLLVIYQFEKEFIDKIPRYVKLSDIESVVIRYGAWKRQYLLQEI